MSLSVRRNKTLEGSPTHGHALICVPDHWSCIAQKLWLQVDTRYSIHHFVHQYDIYSVEQLLSVEQKKREKMILIRRLSFASCVHGSHYRSVWISCLVSEISMMIIRIKSLKGRTNVTEEQELSMLSEPQRANVTEEQKYKQAAN